ncbi:hypothetical protein [Mesorhizobium sp. 8]|uniref:hypothetical protein n=1 Tax=Mesorhizobium sp. 8 TaxID=2584466 RepID=UPI00111CDF07|nr:hypothetical protein [Mesorhizobium sp. 8]QDC02978.1 hypothetical protein FGU64_22730 [Mesorhizobium sp. 8]
MSLRSAFSMVDSGADLGVNPFAAIMPHLYLWVPGLYGGPFGVALFLLISGFVIPISLQKMAGTRYWVPRFALARLVRLWPLTRLAFSSNAVDPNSGDHRACDIGQ